MTEAPNYTQIPNSFLDNLHKFGPYETKIIMLVCRKTFGYHKTADDISYSQIVKGTGISRRKVISSVAGLCEKGYLNKSEGVYGNSYTLNLASAQDAPLVHTVHPPSAHDAPPPVHSVHPQKKTNQKKTSKENKKTSKKEFIALATQEPKTLKVGYRQRAQQLLETYNENRGALPEAKELNTKRERELTKLFKTYGENAHTYLSEATKEVANDSFWIDRKYNIDNLLADGRVLSKSEKFRAGQNESGMSGANLELAKTASSIYASLLGGN